MQNEEFHIDGLLEFAHTHECDSHEISMIIPINNGEEYERSARKQPVEPIAHLHEAFKTQAVPVLFTTNSPMLSSTESLIDSDDIDCILTPLISPDSTPSNALQMLNLDARPPPLSIATHMQDRDYTHATSSSRKISRVGQTVSKSEKSRFTPYQALTPSQLMDMSQNLKQVLPVANEKVLDEEARLKLAEKSNYQNIASGDIETLGIRYSSDVVSGIDMRKTNHKYAEQRRRDSLKRCFDELRTLLPNITEKNPSKLHILEKTCEFLRELKK